MNILSHRGIGFGEHENSEAAFRKAIEDGFDLEIDVRRSANGAILVSHDAPKGKALEFRQILELLQSSSQLIAVHVKDQSNTLVEDLCALIKGSDNIFLFDLTIEMARAAKNRSPKTKVAFSVSDMAYLPTIYRLDQVLDLDSCDAIWWDEWNVLGAVYREADMEKIKAAGKKVYAISPELHATGQITHKEAKQPKDAWKKLIELGVDGICTDFPKELKAFIQEHVHA